MAEVPDLYPGLLEAGLQVRDSSLQLLCHRFHVVFGPFSDLLGAMLRVGCTQTQGNLGITVVVRRGLLCIFSVTVCSMACTESRIGLV